MREYATNAVLLVLKSGSDLELALIEQFQRDRSPLVRGQAVARLGDIGASSPAREAVLLAALEDRELLTDS